MSDAGVMRLLALVAREMDAADARIQIGGKEPEEGQLLWTVIGPHRRLVVVFAAPPADRPDKQSRLDALAAAFLDTAAGDVDGEGIGGAGAGPTLAAGARAALDLKLEATLAGVTIRAGAIAALVVDRSSPVVWGRSDAALPRAVDELLARGDVVARAVELARGVTERRHVTHEASFGAYVRSMLGSYLLVLAFDSQFREPHVEGVVRRAQKPLESLIAALPPIDPPPRRGKLRLVEPR